MNLFSLVFLISDITIFCHGAELDPPATDIAPSVVVEIRASTSTFEYAYEVISAATSMQDIDGFIISVGTMPVAETIKSPPGWIVVPNTFGTRGWLSWGGVAAARIKPGTSKKGFVVVSVNPPQAREILLRGFVPTPAVEHVDENTPAPRDPEVDSIHIMSIGPSTFTFTNADAPSAIDRLISLKHESVALGWLVGDNFIKKLDKRLERAKKALGRDRKFLAKTHLKLFIKDLERQREKQQKQDRKDDDKDGKKPKPFLNDNAYYLLKVNAEFIINKLGSP